MQEIEFNFFKKNCGDSVCVKVPEQQHNPMNMFVVNYRFPD